MIPEIQTFLLAMTPIGELRVSLPVALTIYRLDWYLAYFLSVIGNLVPVFLILSLLRPISDFLSKRISLSERFFSRLFFKTKSTHSWKMKKYGLYALVAFVAVPLPFTGGWTASLIAVAFGIPIRKSFPLIALGVAISGLIVLSITKTGITIEKYFGWQVLTGLLLTIGLIWLMYSLIRNKKKQNIIN